MEQSYAMKLEARIDATGSRLCVGLDPRADLIEGSVEAFLLRVVEESAPHAAAFKPNMAYFEAMGVSGLLVLEKVLAAIPDGVPVILDAKRGDIGETQRYYAQAYFENWGVDAVTLSPYMGYDSVEPFLDYPGKGVYLLGVTSNAGSQDIQRQILADGRQVFELVQDFALRAAKEERPGSVGLVMGLTNVGDSTLERVADLPLLVPGLGAQGGDLTALRRGRRKAPCVINVSRGILFAEPERSFAEKAQYYADQIANQFRGDDRPAEELRGH